MKNSTVCAYKWTFPIVDVSAKAYRCCCKSPFVPIREEIYNDFHLNTVYLKQRRLEMLKGTRHSDCDFCWKIEDSGGISMRTRSNNDPASFVEYFKQELQDEFKTTDLSLIKELVTIDSKILESKRPHRLEIKLGNLCDLQCVYCSAEWSTQWALSDYESGYIDFEKYKSLSKNTLEIGIDAKLWNWIETDGKKTLKNIGFIGGEPSIMPEFYTQLDKLLAIYEDVQSEDIVVWFVTNLNTPPKYFEKFMSYMTKLSRKFKVHITISIESLAQQAEFIRTNLNWIIFEENLKKILEKNQIFDIIAMNPVINVLSVPKLQNFLKWHHDLTKMYNRHIRLNQSMAAFPDYLFPFILPNTFGEYIQRSIDFLNTIEYIDEFGEFNRNEYLNFLKTLHDGIMTSNKPADKVLIKFYTMMNKTCKKLNVSFNELFPELSEFFTHCESIYFKDKQI